MRFTLWARATCTVALSASAVSLLGAQAHASPMLPVHAAPAMSAMPAMAFPSDSVCTAIQVSGTVMDTAHTIKAGVWVRDRLGPDAKKVRTDRAGRFQFTVDTMPSILLVFADSTAWQPKRIMGAYDIHDVPVQHCVATLPSGRVMLTFGQLMGEPPKEDPRTWQLTVRPRTMATGGNTAQAGLVTLAGFPDYVLYVPPACVGTRRCPLVTILHGAGYSGASMIEWERPAADKYGTLIFAPTSVSGQVWLDTSRVENQRNIDSALKYILKNYAVDPEKLAIIGRCNGGPYSLGWGGANPDVFSRVVIISGAYAKWMNLVDPTNKTSQFLVDAGYVESAEDFELVHALRQAGHPVKKIMGLRGHEHQVEDYDFVGHLLQESWAITNPAARPAPATLDSPPLLTTNALRQLKTFWTAFARLPDSVSTTARQAHIHELSMMFKDERASIIMTDMEALAHRYPAVADALKTAGLTAQQEDAYRAAFVQATALSDMRGDVGADSTSVAAQNVAFLKSHPDEIRDAADAIVRQP